MSTSLVHLEQPPAEPPFALTQAQARLRQMVLDSVQFVHSKRNYAKALDDLFAFCASRPLSRALLMEYRTTMELFSPFDRQCSDVSDPKASRRSNAQRNDRA
jgi:hypothetical protein